MSKPLRILMLEDLEEDAGLIDRVLMKEKIHYERRRVDTQQEFIAALDEFEPDLVLSDHSLPQFNSTEALKIARSKMPAIPFILVTGMVSEEFAVGSLKQGADDYVLKTNLSRLPLAIRHALTQRRLEQERIAQEISLQQKNKELLKAVNELDSFVYSVSHSLRGPVSTILGVLHVSRLESEITETIAAKYLSMIESNVTQLNHTIEEILDFALNMHNEFKIEVINLRGLIDRCLSSLDQMQNFNNTIKSIEVTGLPEVRSDDFRIVTVLRNVISNAIEFQDQHKDVKTLKVIAVVSPNDFRIEIHDNGIGIEQVCLSRIYDMFFRGSNQSKGVGLGLYVAKEIMDKMGGSIHVTSVFGEGTSVYLRFPNAPGPSLG